MRSVVLSSSYVSCWDISFHKLVVLGVTIFLITDLSVGAAIAEDETSTVGPIDEEVDNSHAGLPARLQDKTPTAGATKKTLDHKNMNSEVNASQEGPKKAKKSEPPEAGVLNSPPASHVSSPPSYKKVKHFETRNKNK